MPVKYVFLLRIALHVTLAMLVRELCPVLLVIHVRIAILLKTVLPVMCVIFVSIIFLYPVGRGINDPVVFFLSKV